MATRITAKVREADFERQSDRTAIIDVLDSYASDPVGGGRPLRAEVRERLIPALRAQPGALVLLAFVDDLPVGLAACFMGFSTFEARPLLNIHDLAVLPAYRGRGIGRALLTEAERRALEAGCCKLTLEVQEDNLRARTLYERFGFSDFVIGESAPTRFLSKALESSLTRSQ